jgi:hypothetical protein
MFRLQTNQMDSRELERIVSLLRHSELTLSEIAARMRRSRTTIAALNRKFQIREYQGQRSQ